MTTIQLLKFNWQSLVDDQQLLTGIAQQYCNTWETDPNFGEYRKCAHCGRYASIDEVVTQNNSSCPKCGGVWIKAWEPERVAHDLLTMSQHHSFSGTVLLDQNSVLGFVWGRLYDNEQMKERWGDLYQRLVEQNHDAFHCFYIEEIAVVPSIRGMGYGKHLVSEIVRHAMVRYPSQTSAFGTHRQSAMAAICEKIGYQFLDDHPVGQGRIRMGISRINDIRIFNL